jgi:hypothetical protein
MIYALKKFSIDCELERERENPGVRSQELE